MASFSENAWDALNGAVSIFGEGRNHADTTTAFNYQLSTDGRR